LLRLHPWRSTWRLLEDALASIRAKPLATLQQEMHDLAKQGLLCAEDMLVLHVLLFFSEEDKLAYAGAVLGYAEMPRTQIFNAIVAGQEPPAGSTLPSAELFLTQQGQRILQCPYPLWPREERFNVYQNMVLNCVASAVVTGGASRKEKTSFADDSFGLCAAFGEHGTRGRHSDPAIGGGTLPVQQDANGAWVVDTTPVEQAFDQLYHGLVKLQGDVQQLQQVKQVTDVKALADALTAQLTTQKEKLGVARGALSRAVQRKSRGAAEGPKKFQGRARAGERQSGFQ
jgi:hypothetical protein